METKPSPFGGLIQTLVPKGHQVPDFPESLRQDSTSQAVSFSAPSKSHLTSNDSTSSQTKRSQLRASLPAGLPIMSVSLSSAVFHTREEITVAVANQRTRRSPWIQLRGGGDAPTEHSNAHWRISSSGRYRSL